MRMISPDELMRAVAEVHAVVDSGALNLEDVTLEPYKADASPVIDFTVLQGQEEPNAKTVPAKRTRKSKAAK